MSSEPLVSAVPSSFSSAGLSSLSSLSSEAPAAEQFRIKFALREDLSVGRAPQPKGMFHDAEIVDAEAGLVQVVLPPEATFIPGVYFGEMAILLNTGDTDDDGEDDFCLLLSNTFYVIIDRGNFGKHFSGRQLGPPTIMEIRLHIRDSCPEENSLLDNIKFDDAEIALAISRPVMYWNEIPPPIQEYTTQDFPFRFHWLEGIVGQLYLIVAEQMRANNLTYSAAGLKVNDQNKEPNYEQAALTRWGNFLSFVRHKKGQMNVDMAYGGIGSSYRYGITNFRGGRRFGF